MHSGPFFPGFHILIGLAFVVFWLVVVSVLFLALYFVIRHAVTDGTLRADALREGRPYVRPRRVAAAHAGAPATGPAPAAPVASAAGPAQPAQTDATAPITPLPPADTATERRDDGSPV